MTKNRCLFTQDGFFGTKALIPVKELHKKDRPINQNGVGPYFKVACK